MISSLNRRIALFAIGAFCGCVALSVLGAAQSGQMTLDEVVRRLLALEDRVATLERKVGISPSPGEQPPKPTIEITTPRDRDEVGQRVLVEGIVRVDDLRGRVPVVLVRPVNMNVLWVQPPVTVGKSPEGFKFRVGVYLGERERGRGEYFKIVAWLAPKGKYKEGDQLDVNRLPPETEIPSSRVVLVHRTKD